MYLHHQLVAYDTPSLVLHYILTLQVPVACLYGSLWVRISAQIYNRDADYEHLANAIEGMMA